MQEATGQGIEIIIKGNSYTVYPILMSNIWEFESYVRSERIKLLNNIEDKELRKEMIYDIMNYKFKTTKKTKNKEASSELNDEMNKPKGIMFLLWKALRNDTTLEEVNQLIDADNLDEILTVVSGLYGVTEKK